MTTTPIDELRQTIQSVLNEYVDCYKIGFNHARDGKEKDWFVVQKLADKHTDVVMSRIHKALAVRENSLLDELQSITDKYGTGWVEQMGMDELRTFIKTKRANPPKTKEEHVHDNFCLNYGKCSE